MIFNWGTHKCIGRPAVGMWLALLAVLALPGTTLAAGKSFALFPYWHDGHELSWYSFGSRSPVHDGRVQSPSVWVLYTSLDKHGQPVRVPGQGSIFDTELTDPSYSDLWQMILVQAPSGYVANSITSLAQIEQAGLRQTPTSTLVDCPFVDETDVLAGGVKPVRGWARGAAVWYVDLGPARAEVGQMWRFASGTDASGKPVPLGGQFTVSDASSASFRELYWVQAPAGYVPNSIKTMAALKASGFPVTPTHVVMNVPLPPAPVAPSGEPGRAGYGIIGVFAAAFLGSAVYLLRLPKPQALHPNSP